MPLTFRRQSVHFAKGVTVEIRGIGQIAKGVGELIIAVLAQVADMERQRIPERTTAGREVTRASLAATGKTHKGKESLGRPTKGDAATVRAWRTENSASIRDTAAHFDLSDSTVKRTALWRDCRPWLCGQDSAATAIPGNALMPPRSV
jgi:putative DNA-invertase from lambdoid prophage Rac